MLLYFSVWFILKCSSSAADLAANFTGHSFIAFYLPNQTEDSKLELSFRTSFPYGLVFSAFDSIDMLYRVHLENRTLMVDLYGMNTTGSSSNVLCDCFDPSVWNIISVIRISNIVTIFIKKGSYQFKLYNKKGIVEESIYLGGLPSTTISPYHQFHGYMTNITLFGREVLASTGDQPPHNVSYKNIDVFSRSDLVPGSVADPYQTVTINNSEIRFPVAHTSYTNFSFSFEFKSPENVLQFLSFQMKQYFFSLRKDYKQLILELNLHGEGVRLAVELSSVTQWISVGIQVTDQVTLLSSGDRKNEVQSRSPIANKRFNRRPLFFGSSESNSAGFRGCIRKFVVNGERLPLYSRTLSQTSTLVGCWYPTPTCDNISCPLSCSQTWDETKCTTVGMLPKTAEFAGFGIIQIHVPTLLPEQDDKLTISLKFVSRSSKDDVLMSLQHSQDDMASFFIIQMLEGYLMFSLSLTDDNTDTPIMLNTDTPLNDGKSHIVTVTVTSTDLSFQVDARTWGRSHEVDVSVFRQPTSIKIGGSSLKLNNWGFTGCLSEIEINSEELLSRTTSHSDSVVIQSDVQLQDECSLVEETESPRYLTSAYKQASSTAPPGTKHTGVSGSDESESLKTSKPPTNLTYPVQKQPEKSEERSGKADEQLLIGLMLGFVTLLAIAIFLAYFLWQRRQMHQNAKERARKASDELALDEEFLNKTYNPKKEDKYTLFTPHALDAIEEETASMVQGHLL